jgi:hypothetical protein
MIDVVTPLKAVKSLQGTTLIHEDEAGIEQYSDDHRIDFTEFEGRSDQTQPVTATLIAFPGGRSRSVLQWEADIERLIADTITGYTAEHPCPAPSIAADDLTEWAYALRRDADARTRRDRG